MKIEYVMIYWAYLSSTMRIRGCYGLILDEILMMGWYIKWFDYWLIDGDGLLID